MPSTHAFAPQRAPQPARIMLVDDDPDLLEGLLAWLELFDYDVQVAHSGHEAMSLLRCRPVDVVVTDLKMPYMDGLDLLGLIKAMDPSIQVIFLSGQATMEDAILALREGKAFDFLKKPLEDPQVVNLAIERALSRRHQTSVEPAPPASVGVPDPNLAKLNEREREILALIFQGLQHREIADRVGLSEKTVRNYLSVVYEKLGVTNLPQAILYCLKAGFMVAP